VFFDIFAHTNRVGKLVVTHDSFRPVMSELEVLMSEHTYSLLWLAIDEDLSDECTWEEMCNIMFPEVDAKLNDTLIDVRVASLCSSPTTPFLTPRWFISFFRCTFRCGCCAPVWQIC